LLLTVDSGADAAGKVVLVLDAAHPQPGMPQCSCFASVAAAYDFLVDFYDAFAYDPAAHEVFLLRIERGPWDVRILEPVDYYLGYFAAGPIPPDCSVLDSVFYFRDVPYRWLPLLKERIKHTRC
jgi:hypothetical protein